MKVIKDALRLILGVDAEIEWDLNGPVVSGLNDTMLIVVTAPCEGTSSVYWNVRIYPRASSDHGEVTSFVNQYLISEAAVIEYLLTSRLTITEQLLYILTKDYNRLHDILEDIDERGKDLDLCDFD
jgi:hypothetical protein